VKQQSDFGSPASRSCSTMGTEGKKSLGFLDKWWWYGCPEGLDHSFCSSDLGEEKYKELQTVAYDNPHGFSWVLLFEIYAFVFLMPVLLIVGQKVKENTGCTNARVFGIGSFFWDFLFVFGPPTLLMLAPPFLFLLVGYMGAFFLALCITLWQQGSSGKIDGIPVRVDERSRPLFLSTYRAVMMVSTCVAILAVDFLAFPRRFAKSLRLGFSLMDAGVGGVLFAGGAVSRWARGDKNSSPLLNSLARLWPLLVMGTARFVIIWVADKHVPATEYGVHWNFFFTLGVVAVGAVVAEKLVSPEHAWVLAALISGIYECFLCLGGGEEFILDSSRTNFFSSNREGILGCLGFLSVHLCGVSVGRGVFISFVEGEELTAEELNNQTSSGVELEGEKEKEKEKEGNAEEKEKKKGASAEKGELARSADKGARQRKGKGKGGADGSPTKQEKEKGKGKSSEGEEGKKSETKFPNETKVAEGKFRIAKGLHTYLFKVLVLSLSVAAGLSESFGAVPSRRMANAGYVLHTVALNVFAMQLFFLGSRIVEQGGGPTIPVWRNLLVEAIHENQLTVFLVVSPTGRQSGTALSTFRD